MLSFVNLSHPLQLKELVGQYDPLKDTWIVSDLKSKQEIQNESIKKHSYFTDEAILRASDFWRLWIRRIDPTLSLVSSDFIKSLVQNFVDQYGKKLDLLDSEVSTLARALQEFAPMHLHPNSNEVLEEWLAQELKKNKTEKKWQKWFQYSKVCLSYILKEHHVIDAKWAAAYLQSIDLNLIQWPRRVFVDLGSELSSVEMGLFRELAQNQDVVIISPKPEWSAKFENLLGVYKDSFGYGQVQDLNASYEKALKSEQFVRLSTQLAEIKFAVAKCRQWADTGVNLKNISIVAADIERYWPVLQHYLDVEGLPYSKDTVAQINSLGDVQNLLAILKNYSQDVGWDSLEKIYFSKESEGQQYEKFKALFYQLYDSDDLSRDQKIKDLYYKKINFSEEMSRDDFLTFLVKTWLQTPNSTTKSEIFETIFKDFLAQSLNIQLMASRWIAFLKNRLSSKEITLKRSTAGGINVLSLMSAQMSDSTHKIYLGLNDELYAKKNKTLMSHGDAVSIKRDFDLSIDCSEESYLDFNLRWQAMAATPHTYFTSAHLSFESDPLNASLFFIENLPKSDVLSPDLTRADEVQKSFRSADSKAFQQLSNAKRLQQDMQGYEEKISVEPFKKLSVSDIENYAQCSFKLLASRGFKLRDYAQVGIDLDSRDKGTLTHALFEYVLAEMQTATPSEEQISAHLEKKRTELNLYKGQDLFWGIQKTKFLKLAQKFISFETKRVQQFRSEVEKDYTLYFDLNKKVFSVTPVDGDCYTFNLRIDRIDQNKNQRYYIVYDYKSGASALPTAKKFISQYQFQMLLYLSAVKLTVDDPSLVKGALYYLYKSFDFSKGVIDKQIGQQDFELGSRNSSLVDSLEELDQQFLEAISGLLSTLNTGIFKTNPLEIKICSDCDWNKLCRAPHLM